MKALLISITAIFFTSGVAAKTLWQDFSLTFLHGENYKVGHKERQVATIEYASATTWGDTFMFVDRLHSKNGDKETYMEFSPRIKVVDYQNALIENVYIATTAEVGDGFTNYLYGVGTKLKVPSFHYFNLNFYRRNNDGADNGYQTTISWGVPVGPLYFDGFVDHVPSTDDSATTTNFTSQLKYDIGQVLGLDTKLYVGLEYAYWNNKFGINGIDERNGSLLVKYHF
ncbi:nucleoside-binding protein [Colwellia sp. MEBiC06753]